MILQNISVLDTWCSGFLCDRQRIKELNRDQAACGCFQSSSRVSNMVIYFDLEVKGNAEFKVNQFSSNKFSNLFINEPFPGALNWRAFDHNKHLNRLIDFIESIITYININCGWIVSEWSKRGEVSDMALLAKESVSGSKISASDIKHQLTSIDINIDFDVNEEV